MDKYYNNLLTNMNLKENIRYNIRKYLVENNIVEVNDFTKTPEFINWFGDSKVVDSNGDPLPLYHGSPVGGIQNFNLKGNNNTTLSSGLKEFGICFTTNPELAVKYKNERKLSPEFIKNTQQEISKLENIMLNSRNSKEFYQLEDETNKLKNKLRGGVYQTYLKILNPFIFDAKGKDGYDGWKELKVNVGYKTAIGIDAIEAISGNNSMYNSTYDGIIAKNIIDIHIGNNNLDKYKQFSGDVYMVFSPQQTMIEKDINTFKY